MQLRHESADIPGHELRELWRRYWHDDNAGPARETLILHYAPLVKFLAGRLQSRLPPHIDEADLISSGLMGLLNAMERYDPDRGVEFEAFAKLRIRGAMLDSLRSMDWVPRRVRENARKIARVESSLRARLGRSPSEKEIATGLDLGVISFRRLLLEIHNSKMFSLDEPQTNRGTLDPDHPVALIDLMPGSASAEPQGVLDDSENAAALKMTLSLAIGSLPEREQFVLACRYQEDLRFGEIAEVLGMSESRVSQLHTKALISLRGVVGVDRAGDLTFAHA